MFLLFIYFFVLGDHLWESKNFVCTFFHSSLFRRCFFACFLFWLCVVSSPHIGSVVHFTNMLIHISFIAHFISIDGWTLIVSAMSGKNWNSSVHLQCSTVYAVDVCLLLWFHECERIEWRVITQMDSNTIDMWNWLLYALVHVHSALFDASFTTKCYLQTRSGRNELKNRDTFRNRHYLNHSYQRVCVCAHKRTISPF